jgi:hypothetical protein
MATVTIIFGWGLLVFWIWMFFDCVRNEDDRDERVAWAFVLLFLNVLIAPFYYFIVHRKRVKVDPTKEER